GISEAVFLGTRVVVFTAGPARMADDFKIDLPHPRTLDMKTHEGVGVYTRRIYKLLGMEGARAARGRAAVRGCRTARASPPAAPSGRASSRSSAWRPPRARSAWAPSPSGTALL